MFCITGWIESEPSNTFNNPTDDWNWTWFGAHICRHETRLLIFWNKKTIFKQFLQKTDRNVNLFNYRSKSFSFNSRNTTCVVLPIYYWCSSVEFYGFHVAPYCLRFNDRLAHASNLSISGFRFHSWLNMYSSAYRKTNKSINNTWNQPSYVNNYSIMHILMKLQTILVCVVFQLIPTPCKSDEI